MLKRIVLTVDDDARTKVISGVNKSANILRRTLGNKGRNVAIDTDKYRVPLLTNDGISILNQLHFEDDAEELGLKLVRQAAAKTEDHAGDGTTTTTVLMQALLKGIAKSDIDVLDLRAEIEEAVNEVVKYIGKHAKEAKDVDTLAKAATISCRDPKIGKLIAEIVVKAKDDGMITLEDNLAGKTEVIELEGLQLRTGYAAKQFVNQPSVDQVVVTNPAFIVGNMALNDVGQFRYIAERTMANQRNVVVVIAQDIGTEFMMHSYINWLDPKSPCKILPVRFNQQADIADGMLRDVAAVTGAHFIDVLLGEGLEWLDGSREDSGFGAAKKFVQGKKESTVFPSNKHLVEQRAGELKNEYKSAQDFQAENIRERIARLKSACFTIRVGGSTETELRERKTRVQDALNTARAAYEKGVVKGGGLTLANAAESQNSKILGEACLEPLAQLATNNSKSIVHWHKIVQRDDTVWDSAVATIESLVNASSQAIQIMLMESAVIDPEVNQ